MIKWYRQKIEKELDQICLEVLNLLKDVLIPNSTQADSRVFYMKMRGDYFRYLCEFFGGDK